VTSFSPSSSHRPAGNATDLATRIFRDRLQVHKDQAKKLQTVRESGSIVFRFLDGQAVNSAVILCLWVEQMRQNDRAIKRTQRDIDRERTELERQEKKLVSKAIHTYNMQ